jgi:hypothetical protein
MSDLSLQLDRMESVRKNHIIKATNTSSGTDKDNNRISLSFKNYKIE